MKIRPDQTPYLVGALTGEYGSWRRDLERGLSPDWWLVLRQD